MLKLSVDKVPILMEETGNTGSASSPLLIDRCRNQGQFKGGADLLLIEFGVGFSWGATHLQWLRDGELKANY